MHPRTESNQVVLAMSQVGIILKRQYPSASGDTSLMSTDYGATAIVGAMVPLARVVTSYLRVI